MKQCFLFVCLSYFFLNAYSAPTIKAVANGYWNSASTWNLNRLPQVGDTIIIPAGKTVNINDDRNLNGSVYLKIYGKLGFQNNNSTLNLGNSSVIMVYSNAQILGGGSASQKIRIANNAVFKGNEPPVNGPMMANGSGNGFQPFTETTLPVQFVGFTLTRKSNDVCIQWATSEEINAHSYELERSYNGADWSTIAYISAVGNSASVNNYSFTDKNNTVIVSYYRIKQVDLDGKYVYTSVKSVKCESINKININIAAINGKILLQFPQEIKEELTVRFVSLNGQVVDQQILKPSVGQVVLNARAGVKGNCVVAISNGQDLNIAKQIIL